MKKLYSFIALAMLTMSTQAQVTYDFTTVATDNGVHATKYGNGNDSDSEWALSIHSETADSDIPMVYLVDENGNDYDKRFAIQNRADAWRFRNTKDGVWRGIWAQYDRYFAILNLNPGDEITLVMSPDDQNRGMVFDVKDYDEDEIGRYACVSREELNDRVTAMMEAAGLTTETITEEQLAAFREEVKTNKFKIYTDAASLGFTGTLLMKSEGGQYIEKITITPAGGEDGIQELNTADTDNQWYDLRGCKVTRPAKGIYISNGKKFVVK